MTGIHGIFAESKESPAQFSSGDGKAPGHGKHHRQPARCYHLFRDLEGVFFM